MSAFIPVMIAERCRPLVNVPSEDDITLYAVIPSKPRPIKTLAERGQAPYAGSAIVPKPPM
ncbi:MAG: hypothetical protein ABIF77_05410 [bacterium]